MIINEGECDGTVCSDRWWTYLDGWWSKVYALMTIGEDSTLKDDESKSYGSKINKDECDSTVTVMD